MAKRRAGGENKSQAIRDLLQATPDIKAKDAIAALAGKGVKVNAGLFYLVKGKMNERKRRKGRVVRAARAAAGSNGSGNGDAITLIREIKALAERTGGIGKLKALVEALAE